MDIYEEMKKLSDKAIICKEINKQANALINANIYNDFTRIQLRMIAELSATEGLVAGRTMREKLKEYEDSLSKCRELCDKHFSEKDNTDADFILAENED